MLGQREMVAGCNPGGEFSSETKSRGTNLFHTKSLFDISCHTLCPRPHFLLYSHLTLLESCCFVPLGSKGQSLGYTFVCMLVLSHVLVFAFPWTVACQTPLSMEFSR